MDTNDEVLHDQSGRDTPHDRHDLTRYTMTVDTTVLEFAEAHVNVSRRSVQRYCNSGALECARIDPDTREATEKAFYIFLIDPASIPKRIEQLREKREFRDVSHDASGRGLPRQGTPSSGRTRRDDPDAQTRIEELEAKLQTAEFEKKIAYRLAKDRQEEVTRLGDLVGDARELIGNLKQKVFQLGGKVEERNETEEVNNTSDNADIRV